MAFNPQPPKAEYQATAGQTIFPFLFKIYFDTDIKVYHTPSTGITVELTLYNNYGVAINGDDGGTITINTSVIIEDGDYIVLERELQLNRYVEYQTSGDLLADTLNADQDYQTYLISDQNTQVKNSLYLADGTFGVDTEIPSPIANQYLKWNSSASKIEYAPSSSISIDWGNISGTLSDQTDLQSALDLKSDTTYVDSENSTQDTATDNKLSLKADKSYVDSENDTQYIAIQNRIVKENGTWTGILSGNIIHATSSLKSGDFAFREYGSAALIEYQADLSHLMLLESDAKLLHTTSTDLTWDSVPVVVGNASDTNVGGIKILVVGSDCYITTDGSTPGP